MINDKKLNEEDTKNKFNNNIQSNMLLTDSNKPLNQFIHDFDNLFDNFGKIQIFLHSIEERLFDFLDEPKSVEEIAKNFKWDISMAELYCLCLVSLQLIHSLCDHDEATIKYINTSQTNMFLTSFSPLSQLNNLQNKINRIRSWQYLPESLKNGPIVIEDSQLFTRQWITGIAEGSLDGQIPKLIDTIKKSVNLDNLHNLLDLGGGHGYYSAAFSYYYPNLKCTVFDLPEITPIAKDLINKFSDQVNVDIISGDYLKDPIIGKYDIIFSSFSRCGSDPQLIEKIKNSLNPNGLYIIRRHAEHLKDDPFHNLEWNLKRPVSRKKITGRYNLTEYPTIEEYISLLEKNKFTILYHNTFDEISDLIIAALI